MSTYAYYLTVVAIVLSAMCNALAALPELPDPAITSAAPEVSPASNIFDNDLNTYYAGYAGPDGFPSGPVFLNFDFGTPTTVAGFKFVQMYWEVYRTDGANLIFSNNSDFSNPVATVFVDTTGAWAYELGNLANSTVTVDFEPITARYVKWDVTAIGYPAPPYSPDRYPGATEMAFLAPFGYATSPIPSDGSINVDKNTILSWISGPYATSHEVYFGTDRSAVENATKLMGDINGSGKVDFEDLLVFAEQWLYPLPVDSNFCADLNDDSYVNFTDFAMMANDWLQLGDGVYRGHYPRSDSSYSINNLEIAKTYFWRVDEVNDSDLCKGNIWSFTTVEAVVPLTAAGFPAVPSSVPAVELPDGPGESYSVSQLGDNISFDITGTPSQKRTMTWVSAFGSAKTLSPFVYYVLQYKATGISRTTGKYNVVSIINGSDVSQTLLDCSEVINDNLWHVVVGKTQITDILKANVSFSTTGSSGSFIIGALDFSFDVPISPKGFTYDNGWDTAPEGQQCIDLSGQFNDSLSNVFDQTLQRYGRIVDGVNSLLTEHIAVSGVQFNVPTIGNNLIRPSNHPEINNAIVQFCGQSMVKSNFFPEGRDDIVTIPIGQNVSEVLFILMSEMPTSSPHYGASPYPSAIDDIGAFSVELFYSDSNDPNRELAFPYSIADEGFIVRRAMGAYAVAADPNRTLASVVFHNKSFMANMGIAAVTVNTSAQRIVPAVLQEQAVIDVPNLPDPDYVAPYMQLSNNIITCGNTYYQMVIDCSTGFAITGLTNKWSSATSITLANNSGLEVIVGDTVLTGLNFACQSVTINGTTATIVINHSSAPSLSMTITVGVDASENCVFGSSVTNGASALAATIKFPILKNVIIGTLGDTWLYFPANRSVLSNGNGFHFASNDIRFPMQFCDMYNPATGIGVMVLTHNLSQRAIDYSISKNDQGVSSFVQYEGLYYKLNASQVMPLTETCIVPHKGDWNGATSRYKQWVDTWYQSSYNTSKDWWYKVFLMRSEFTSELYFPNSVVPKVLDRTTGQIRLSEIMDATMQYNGAYPDLIQYGDWWIDDSAGLFNSYGDYSLSHIGIARWDSLIQQTRNGYGMKVSSYTIPGYLSKVLPVGQQYGSAVAIRDEAGNALQDTSLWYPCVGSTTWQDYFASTVTRVQSETTADAIYLDVFGATNENYVKCYSVNHGHSGNPLHYTKATYDFVKRMREALPYNTVLWSEYQSDDFSSQYFDGHISYYFMPIHGIYGQFTKSYNASDKAEHNTEVLQNPFRFVFPHIKQLNFAAGITGETNVLRKIKSIFFNGEALYDLTWGEYATQARELNKKTLGIKKRYPDCFSSLSPVPLVPTKQSMVYANKFPGTNRTLWTIYNSRYTTVHGTVLAVDHYTGARYLDVWNNKRIYPQVVEDKAIINVTLDPQELGCVVQY